MAHFRPLMTDYPKIPIAFGARVRPSPYFESTLEHGVSAFSVYNRMLIPTSFKDTEEAYWDLVKRVTVWDVGCERQVEITGPDAASFTQYLVTRDVNRIRPGEARYTLVCQDDGGILNDPIMVRLAENHFWLSLADSDILLWAKGVAHNSGFDVGIVEPDVSPIQVQGPYSPDLMRLLIGDAVDSIGFYEFVDMALDGVPMVVARTGWSGEVGYEIFLRDGSKGGWLWDRLFEVGEEFGVMPGAPNNIRRMEAGFLSWGNDMDWNTNPYEMGLGKFVNLDSPDDFVGKPSLQEIANAGPSRKLTGLFVDGEPMRQGPLRRWPVAADGRDVGFVTSAIWTPGMKQNIAYAILDIGHSIEGIEVVVTMPGGDRAAITTAIPFVNPRYRD